MVPNSIAFTMGSSMQETMRLSRYPHLYVHQSMWISAIQIHRRPTLTTDFKGHTNFVDLTIEILLSKVREASEVLDRRLQLISFYLGPQLTMVDLCFEVIIFCILTRLTAKDVVNCKSVCKEWRVLLSTNEFERAHTSRSTIPTNQKTILICDSNCLK